MSEQISVDQVIDKLPSRFCPDQAKDLSCTFQFIIDDENAFYIAIHEQQCQVVRQRNADPDITLYVGSEAFIRVVTGEQDGMSAFLKGQLRAEGNIMLATRLGKLFSRQRQR
ncbi:SCP2 sterol-binding domain-containing protein [Marinobacterium sedimentorum]|uniref:SCP2 sterol-binding domain-containing protein n=1 Tax=Marinobacterium sedimentorum TaxID=2927804 RepID=UPI0020C63706|nr:SCP2 sterol-binding domain-containing protein [Marinobacterium sedimentorum]MCP8686894.1 SCP2 sterol-binding domain-containing protein [Marinobacterium sedimentorum]